jgi:hypothetical protein
VVRGPWSVEARARGESGAPNRVGLKWGTRILRKVANEAPIRAVWRDELCAPRQEKDSWGGGDPGNSSSANSANAANAANAAAPWAFCAARARRAPKPQQFETATKTDGTDLNGEQQNQTLWGGGVARQTHPALEPRRITDHGPNDRGLQPHVRPYPRLDAFR